MGRALTLKMEAFELCMNEHRVVNVMDQDDECLACQTQSCMDQGEAS